MIIWLASYPKSGNTLVRSLLASYIFSKDGNFNFELLKNIKQFPDNSLFKQIGVDINNEKEMYKNYINSQKIFYNKEILSLSLDDYYLTKKQRTSLSKKIHPLLITRGVPGTHDIKKLLKHVRCFERSIYPINIPIFDKINDDRLTKVKKIKTKAEILILEGWCCGSPAVPNSFLKKLYP